MDPLIIHTEGNGRLAADCTASDVKKIAQQIVGAKHAVIHLHGGLVNRKAGVAMATRLGPYYEAAGLQPVFFAWETGPLETIKNNIERIAKENIFQSLLKKLLRHVAGKVLLDTPGAKAAIEKCDLPSPIEVGLELKKRTVNEEPYAQEPPAPVPELTLAEEERFAEDLEGDERFTIAVAEVLAGLNAVPPAGAKGLAGPVTPVPTLMSKEVTDELKQTAEQPGSKGLIETATLIVRAGKVLVKIVRRFRNKRDHGIYTTIVEELLRESLNK